MHIIVLMAGTSTDFEEQGYFYPKYLLEIENKPMIQHAINSLAPVEGCISFIVQQKDRKKFFLEHTVKILCPQCTVISVENETKGTICTALFAIDSMNHDNELLIVNGDQFLNTDMMTIINHFRAQNLDGGVVIFESVHPKWGSVLLDGNGLVVQTSEKLPISNLALAGCYYYKRGSDFVKACFDVIRKDVSVQDNYYISSTYNEMILEHKRIGAYQISRDDYVSFSDYQLYEAYIRKKDRI